MTPPRRPGAPSRPGAGGGARRPRAGTSPTTGRGGGGAGRPPRPVRRTPETGQSGESLARARRRSNLTGRAAVLALVVCALALALAYPLREFLGQRGEISELRDRTAAQQRRVGELEQQKARWKDPAYVKAQARERLGFVLPGETAYVVLDPAEATAPASPGTRTPPPARPWYSDLWASVEAADRGAVR